MRSWRVRRFAFLGGQTKRTVPGRRENLRTAGMRGHIGGHKVTAREGVVLLQKPPWSQPQGCAAAAKAAIAMGPKPQDGLFFGTSFSKTSTKTDEFVNAISEWPEDIAQISKIWFNKVIAPGHPDSPRITRGRRMVPQDSSGFGGKRDGREGKEIFTM